MTEEELLRIRLAYLDAQIRAATSWGAALGAMDEERHDIRLRLAVINTPRTKLVNP